MGCLTEEVGKAGAQSSCGVTHNAWRSHSVVTNERPRPRHENRSVSADSYGAGLTYIVRAVINVSWDIQDKIEILPEKWALD